MDLNHRLPVCRTGTLTRLSYSGKIWWAARELNPSASTSGESRSKSGELAALRKILEPAAGLEPASPFGQHVRSVWAHPIHTTRAKLGSSGEDRTRDILVRTETL